jgi:hypothetical protein
MGIVGVRRRQPELPARELAEAQPGAFIATYWDPTANGGAGG